jgi:hypothetical protein
MKLHPEIGAVGTCRFFVVVASALTLASGCATTELRKAQHLPSEPVPTVVAGYVVRVIPEDGKEGLDLIGMLQNTELEDFGKSTKPEVEAMLKKNGFDPVFDAAAAGALPHANGFLSPEASAVLTGVWHHPESPWVPQQPSVFGDPRSSVLQAQIVTPTPLTSSVSLVEILVQERTSVGLGPVRLWAHPTVYTRVLTFDAHGRLIFEARSRGDGNGTPFVVDRSAANLKVGMQHSIEQLGKVETKPL